MNRKPTAPTDEIEEDAHYVNSAVCAVDKTAATSDQKFRSFTLCFPPVAGWWVILIVIMALRIYFTSVISENNGMLTAQNQQLETQMKNLTDMLQDMETERNELNVSRAQWSIDQYCPIDGAVRQCKSCQKGWDHNQFSCYAVNNPKPPNQKTWDGAQADCKGKISELPVINNAKEKQYISKNSWYGKDINGYWIGLRVVDGKWTWVDGSDLTETSWIQPATPTEGHCAISVQNQGLKSVNCSNRNAWICEKKALSLTPP